MSKRGAQYGKVDGPKQFFVCQTFDEKTMSGVTYIVKLDIFHLRDMRQAIRKAEKEVENFREVGAMEYYNISTHMYEAVLSGNDPDN